MTTQPTRDRHHLQMVSSLPMLTASRAKLSSSLVCLNPNTGLQRADTRMAGPRLDSRFILLGGGSGHRERNSEDLREEGCHDSHVSRSFGSIRTNESF